MTKRLQVLLDEDEYREIQEAARRRCLSVSEWVRQSLRTARYDRPRVTKEEKLRAINDAYGRNYPTADIDVMLAEIEAGRCLPWTPEPRARPRSR